MATVIDIFGGTMMSPVPDPYSVYRRLRREQPVLRIQSPMGEAFLITRYDDVLAVLKNAATFSSRANARGIDVVMGRTILEMDGKEHQRHRNLIAPALLPRGLQKLATTIESIANTLIDRIEDQGRGELVSQFTFTYPLRVIAHIIGIPIEDYERFHHMALDLISIADDPPRSFAAAQALEAYLLPILHRRREEPADDLLSHLARAEIDGERLADEEVISFLRLLLPAGAETTYRLLGSTLFALLTHPEQREEIEADRTCLDLAIEEALRWESPVQYVTRETTDEVEIAGQHLPPGTMIMAALGSANRDEAHYPDPDAFDMHRRAEDHLAFGFGHHFCAGSHLARLESRVALNAILDRLRHLRLDPAYQPRIVGLAFRSPDRLPVLFDR